MPAPMAPNMILPQFFLPRESIKLGRFITSLDHPHQSYHDPVCPNQPQVLVSLRNSYASTQESDTSSSFGSALTALVSTAFSKRANSRVRVVTEHVKTYVLENSDGWFEDATGLTDTRGWIEKQIDQRYAIYMVVGFHTITNARIIQESTHSISTQGQIKVPESLTLAAVGVIAPLGNVIDLHVGGHHYDLNGVNSQFLAPGEQVCALQCRRIRHKWLSSKQIDTLRLAKAPRWSSVESWRDMGPDEEDEVLEVELTEMEASDGKWSQEEVIGDEAFFVR
jgi:hypothetical protein